MDMAKIQSSHQHPPTQLLSRSSRQCLEEVNVLMPNSLTDQSLQELDAASQGYLLYCQCLFIVEQNRTLIYPHVQSIAPSAET